MPNPRRARRAPTLLLAIVAASVCALVAAMLSTPSVAAERSSTRSGAAHVTRVKTVKKHDRVFRARRALVRAQKAFSPSTPAGERPDATLALRSLWLLKDALSPADRAAAEQLGVRPSKPAVIGNDHVLIHYDPAQLNPAAYTIDQAMAAMAYVSDTYASSGYRRPKPDDGKGGDDRIDIYLDPLEPGLYGYCNTDQNKIKRGHYDVWSYCVLDNDYAGFPEHTPLQNLQVTAAHEYYHATQFAYDIAEDRWFLEATATWAEDELYDDVNDNVQYIRDSPVAHPGKSMDRDDGFSYYGVWIFFRYLTEVYPAKTGALPGLLLRMFKNADSSKGPRKNLYSLEAIDKALKRVGNTSLAEEFANFSAFTRFPALFSEGAANSYRTKPLAGGATVNAGKTKTFNATLDHLTSATYRFVPGGGTSKLKLRFDMAPKAAGSRAVVAIISTSGAIDFKMVKVNAHGKASKKFGFDAATVAAVEVTLVDASIRYRECYQQPTQWSCSGRPLDDNLPATVRATAA